METGESQLQTTFTHGPKMPFTPGPWLHPRLKVGCVFVARQNDLYSRAMATPETKDQTFSPGSNHHLGLKVGCVFVAHQNDLYSRTVATPGTKDQTFSPGSNHHPGLKGL